MRLRASPVAGVWGILMRVTFGRTISAPPNIQRSRETVNEMAVHI
jgi:hypothetical protein